MSRRIATHEVFEGENAVILARLVAADGSSLTGSSFQDSVALKVWDATADTPPGTAIWSTTLAKGDVVFNTLQTDGYWTIDGTGYNFRHTVPASSAFPKGGRTYRCEYTLTGIDNALIRVVADIRTKAILS